MGRRRSSRVSQDVHARDLNNQGTTCWMPWGLGALAAALFRFSRRAQTHHILQPCAKLPFQTHGQCANKYVRFPATDGDFAPNQ